ncbi:MAG: ATPase [Gammaproteobacteria bacterium]|nr:ATPase [Gammaproteobacteria bacterium]MDH3411724.1 ATPase [Gammaproteobacteria bacterium]
MRLSHEKFMRLEYKDVTLLGMSGVGKTTLANKLPKQKWFHYSGDYRIGTKYLEEPILDNIKKQAMKVDFLRDLLRSDSIYICSNISVNNLDPISSFLGKIGNPDLGGLSVAEFKQRQRLHHDAEVGAMKDVESFIRKAKEIYGYAHFINDAGGSVCELDDPGALETLVKHTLIIYIRADEDMEQQLIQRQIDNPKPLYYQEAFLDEKLSEYLKSKGAKSVEEIDPDKFVQWTFPKLVAHRRPLYEDIAARYGYTIDAREIGNVRNESDFLLLIRDTLKSQARAA